jgi:hypothetical protein
MDGAFDWGKDKGGKLPRHIERMEETEKPAQMKSGSKEMNLPWGGQPAEQKKAYMSGLPVNKGSMIKKTGNKPPSNMPRNNTKALQGHTPQTVSKKMPSATPMKKGKK